ncbi:MAG: restriction endonuclease subunit S [Sulfurospirillum cavolei]|nr:restriction endonuclease subunit S [Sulfurospirillum cavolei]
MKLPIKNGKIDFDFMENFIAELEAELEAYLLATGLINTTLTDEEEKILEDFENAQWQTFNLEKLFGKSTRGKRLKSDDRICGALPFVTAGEKDTGISAFIGNDVTVFSENTTTIDMFGSAKYRNYKYGGDDHIAVVHTENLPKFAAIFVTTAIHKASYTGKFDYGRNFYAKDADELNISLPIKNNQPDYATMNTFISAIQKLVIKDVVTYADKKIAATQQVIA